MSLDRASMLLKFNAKRAFKIIGDSLYRVKISNYKMSPARNTATMLVTPEHGYIGIWNLNLKVT